MTFAKPGVLPTDIPAIMSRYSFGDVLACDALGGTSHTTYKVVTTGRTVALRVYSRGHSSLDHIQLEFRVLQHLARINFGCPRLLAGSDGELLQRWNGYWLCATDFIPGQPADQLRLNPELVGDVGRLVAAFQNAMASFTIEPLLANDSFLERSQRDQQSLGAALRREKLPVDVERIMEQWEESNAALARQQGPLTSSVIHADLWPPNVLCLGNRVSALLDFDNCCLGPTFVDLALALMEFSMFRSDTLDEHRATAFLAGYFRQGGSLSPLEQSLLVNAMELACASWWAWEQIEAPPAGEAEYYRRRLERLGAPHLRHAFTTSLDRSIARARALALSQE